MTNSLKVLAQSNPAAQVLTAAYAVPAATSATLSSIVVCNSGSAPDKFRIAVAVGGAADAAKQYLYYDVDVPAYESFVLTIGITLGAGDVVRVYAGGPTLSFNIFGVEVT